MRVTASKVGLLEHCGWWARPEAEWLDRPGPAAERGSRFHEAIARYIDTGKVEDVDADILAEYAAARVWVDNMSTLKSLRAEVAFEWNPQTATACEVATNGQRGYPKKEGRLYGTADVVAVDETGCGYVWDFKTGDASNAGPQLRFLALMLARTRFVSHVRVAALEVRDGWVREVCVEELDEMALGAIASELDDLIAAIPSAVPKPGPHCGELYCPARATCPAGKAAIDGLVPETALVKKFDFTPAIKSPEHAVWMLDRCRLASAQIDAIKDAIKAWVPAEGVELPDGSVLRETVATATTLDKAMALSLLRELGATEQQIEGLNRSFQRSNGLRVTKPGGAKPRRKKAA